MPSLTFMNEYQKKIIDAYKPSVQELKTEIHC